MAGKVGKRIGRGGAPRWSRWGDVPMAVRTAVVWAFWAGGPADAIDQERYEAILNMGIPFHEAAFLEESRWMTRSLEALNNAGAFPSRLTQGQIFQAVGLWMGKSAATIKQEAGGYGLRGKPRSSRWVIEQTQQWIDEHPHLPFIANARPDFSQVLKLIEPGCCDATFHSWQLVFWDTYGRQIKARWSNRVLRKNLFRGKQGLHFGYTMRDLSTEDRPGGGLVNHFCRKDCTPLSVRVLDLHDASELDFTFWLTRWRDLAGASETHQAK